MNPRQLHALTNPLSAAGDITPYRTVERRPNGDLLTVILAVDR